MNPILELHLIPVLSALNSVIPLVSRYSLGIKFVNANCSALSFELILASMSAISNVTAIGKDVDAYVQSYQWRMLNNGFYTLPRRMYLGAVLQF